MTEQELSNKIVELYKAGGIQQDRLDCDITLMKISAMQHNDLAAMIVFLETHGDSGQQEPGYILCQVVHDLSGIKAGFLGLPEGVCFSPRSSGYARRTKKAT